MSAVDAVRRLAGESADAAGLVLEDVTVQAAGRRRIVRVVVDLPGEATGGVPMDAVATVSQLLSQRLDDTDAMGGVALRPRGDQPGGGPAADRAAALGPGARPAGHGVTLRAGGSRTGRLEQVDDDGVVLDGTRLAWSDLARGKVEVEFSRPEGDGALDQDPLGDELDDDELDDDETAGGGS